MLECEGESVRASERERERAKLLIDNDRDVCRLTVWWNGVAPKIKKEINFFFISLHLCYLIKVLYTLIWGSEKENGI